MRHKLSFAVRGLSLLSNAFVLEPAVNPLLCTDSSGANFSLVLLLSAALSAAREHIRTHLPSSALLGKLWST